MDEYGSTEAAFAIAGLKTDVTTWSYPNCFVDDRFLFLNDCLSLRLLPHNWNEEIRVGNERELGPPFQRGSLSFFPAGTHMVARTSGFGQSRYVTCFFEGTWFRELSGLCPDLNPSSIQANLDLKNQQLSADMNRLANELLNVEFAAEPLIEALATQIAIELARHLHQMWSRKEPRSQTLTPIQIEKVKEYLDDFQGFLPDMDELAAVCEISGRHFRRLFRETMNKTPNEFARDVWASKVKTLLHATNIPLKQIMFQFGFLSSSSFTMAFHRATGQTPGAYRRSFCQRPVVAMPQINAFSNDQAHWKTIQKSKQQSEKIGWARLSATR